MVRITGISILVLLSGLLGPLAAGAETRLPDQIGQDQILAEEAHPYRLTGDVTINKGTTLTIPAGITVYFNKGSRLIVKGSLEVQGTLLDGKKDVNNREKLVFTPGSRGRLAQSTIQDLEIQIHTSQVTITHSVIANGNGSGITVGKACHPTITWNDFNRNSYYAVYNEGKEVLRAPNNYWGAPDGPSGAGSGRGNAVNPSIDFKPFKRADIGEHLILTVRSLSPRMLRPGSRMTLSYDIQNLNSYAHAVILGATIYKDPEEHIHSPPYDLEVSIKPGHNRCTRPFYLPPDIPEGRYDVLWGIMKTDLTAYHVLAKDAGILSIGTGAVAGPPQAQGTRRALSKQMPF